MKLRVIADDFGLTKGINYGIYDAYKHGIVTAVSLIVNTVHTDHAFDLIKDSSCSIGLSLNVVYGKAISDAKSLVEFDFLKPEHDYAEVKEDVFREYEAQVLKAQSMGIKIAHLTTYGNIHFQETVLEEILVELGDKYQIPVRQMNQWTGIFNGPQASFDTLYQLFCQSLENLEIIVRPGFLDGHLINISSYREWRMVEHSVLSSPIVLDMIDKHKITLVS